VAQDQDHTVFVARNTIFCPRSMGTGPVSSVHLFLYRGS